MNDRPFPTIPNVRTVKKPAGFSAAVNGNGHAEKDDQPVPDIYSAAPDTNTILQGVFNYFSDLSNRFENIQYFSLNWIALSHFSEPKDLSMSLRNIAKNLRDDDKFSTATSNLCIGFIAKNFMFWRDAALAELERFNQQDLALSIWALGKLRILPDSGFTTKMIESFMNLISSSSSQGRSNFLAGLSNLSIEMPAHHMKAWITHQYPPTSHSGSSNEHSITTLASDMRSLAIQHVLSSHDDIRIAARNIFYRLLELKESDFENFHLSQIRDACLWFGLPYVFRTPQKDETKSKSEEMIARAFNKSGVSKIPDVEIMKIMNHKPDIQLSNKDGLRIYIEIDGPNHFVSQYGTDTLMYNGSWILRSAVKARFERSVTVHIPYTYTKPYVDGTSNGCSYSAKDLAGTLKDIYLQARDLRAGIYRIPTSVGPFKKLSEERPFLLPLPFACDLKCP